jgi:hypothetical protein
VIDVQFSSTTDGARLSEAAPLLVVESGDGSEILVPFWRAFLESIDLSEKRIVARAARRTARRQPLKRSSRRKVLPLADRKGITPEMKLFAHAL